MACTPIRDGFVCEIEYVTRHNEAQRRLRRGERQVFCPTCERWRWPEECCHPGRLTAEGFAQALRAREEAKDG